MGEPRRLRTAVGVPPDFNELITVACPGNGNLFPCTERQRRADWTKLEALKQDDDCDSGDDDGKV